MTKYVSNFILEMKTFCGEYNCGFSFVCDSWVSQAKEHILGVVISASDILFPHDDAIGEGSIMVFVPLNKLRKAS